MLSKTEDAGMRNILASGGSMDLWTFIHEEGRAALESLLARGLAKRVVFRLRGATFIRVRLTASAYRALGQVEKWDGGA